MEEVLLRRLYWSGLPSSCDNQLVTNRDGPENPQQLVGVGVSSQ